MRRCILWVAAAMLLTGLGLPGSSSAQDSAYRLGIDDQVQIQVWQRPDLSGVYIVDTDGNVTLPLLGSVQARDLTPDGLGRELERRYSILDPGISQVLVTVTEFASLYVNVVGEVRAAGRHVFRDPPTLWDAILAAGGETPGADMSRVQVVRRSSDSQGPTTVTVDLSGGVEGTSIGSLPVLQPGDNVVVPALSANFLPGGEQIQVLGAVASPGIYPARGVESVLRALTVSGGAVGNADLSEVRLTRPSQNGVLVYHLDLQGYLYEGVPMDNVGVRPGDTITIPTRETTGESFFRVVLQVVPLLTAITSLVLLTRNLGDEN